MDLTTGKIEIDGTEIYYEYIWSADEKPTIVLESGYGWSLENWQSIKKKAAFLGNIFLYDRVGVGRSGNNNLPKHSVQCVTNLRRILQDAGITKPVILVGHSFGGVNVRLFARMYPKEIAGIILIDSVHEEQNRKMVHLFSEEVQKHYLGQFTVEATLKEFELSLDQVRDTKLGNTPLIVMTGGRQLHQTLESMTVWISFQKELAALSTRSKHYFIEHAGHAIHMDAPDAVIKVIEEMVNVVMDTKE